MPTIKVSTTRLENYELDMQVIQSKVNIIMDLYNSVSRNLDWDIKAESGIDSILAGISRELSAEARGISGMKEYLGTARAKYIDVESKNSRGKLTNKTIGSYQGISVGPAISATSGVNDASKKKKQVLKYLNGAFKVGGKFGNVGSIVGSVYTMGSAISSKDKVEVSKGIISVSKDCTLRFGTLAKDAYSQTDVEKTLLGDWTKGGAVTSLFETAEEAAKATKMDIFKAAWTREVRAYKFKYATNVGSKIKVATKWAGVGLTAATNYISNREEQKKNPEMSDKRVVAETVVETVVDVVAGMATTAAITAAIGGAIPAVAVGAITVGVIWGINMRTEKFTAWLNGEKNKKNFTELVSDMFLDKFTNL